MWTQLEKRHEIDAIAESTDPRYVNFVLDTGHITMAGIDPVELTPAFGFSQIVLVASPHNGAIFTRLFSN